MISIYLQEAIRFVKAKETTIADQSPAQRSVELADAFGRAGKTLIRAFDERLGDHGVSTPRSKLLLEVDRRGPVRLTDLARAVGITQGTASTLTDALVREGLVERFSDDNDRRVTLLQTTAAGSHQAQSWATAYATAAQDLLACISDEDKTLLIQSLNHLADSIGD